MRIIRTDGTVTVVGSTAALERHLTIREKTLVKAKRSAKRMSVESKVELFVKLKDRGDQEVIRCHQGLWRRVLDWGIAHKKKPSVEDRRMPFPLPDLKLARGFIHTQKDLFFRTMVLDSGGLVVAPTRYGKTFLIINMCRVWKGLPTLVVLPGRSLVRQMVKTLKEELPGRHIVQIGAGSSNKFQSDDITVCSMDSLHWLDASKFRLVLIDEPHMIATDTRSAMIARFDQARKYGFTATPSGRFDGRDILIEALIGPVLVEKTYREAVAEGAILQIVAIMLKTEYGACGAVMRNACYRRLVWENDYVAAMLRDFSNNVVPPEWQTIVFIDNEKQARFLKQRIPDAEIAMDKVMTGAERDDLFDRLVNDEVKRCLASNILSTGVTMPDLRVIVMAAGGGGNITAIQKPGRLAQIMPGKKYGYVVDIAPHPEYGYKPEEGEAQVWFDAMARQRAYEEKGYFVVECESMAEVAATIRKYENQP
jgi:superfamily II DNA or RNA helicase